MEYYKILNVSPFIKDKDLKKVFRAAIKENHPDIIHTEQASEKYKTIMEAYCAIGSPDKRRLYDEERGFQRKEIIMPGSWV